MDVITYSYLNVGGDRWESVLYNPCAMTLSVPAIYRRSARNIIVSCWIEYVYMIQSGRTTQQVYCANITGILPFTKWNVTKIGIGFQYIVVIDTVEFGL